MSIVDELERPQVRGLRRAEYDQLARGGAFGDERIVLIRGELIRMSPQGNEHSWCIRRLTMLLAPALGDRADVQVQLPFAASDDSEPEPDLSVVPRVETIEDHPSTALLVIEVAASSLRVDLRIKVPLYAAAGVPEVWVVDVKRGVVHVHRDPAGELYETVFTVPYAGSVTPVCFPDLTLPLASFIYRV